MDVYNQVFYLQKPLFHYYMRVVNNVISWKLRGCPYQLACGWCITTRMNLVYSTMTTSLFLRRSRISRTSSSFVIESPSPSCPVSCRCSSPIPVAKSSAAANSLKTTPAISSALFCVPNARCCTPPMVSCVEALPPRLASWLASEVVLCIPNPSRLGKPVD